MDFTKCSRVVRILELSALFPADFLTFAGVQALPILGALVACLYAHTGINIDISIINHIPQNCKRKRADLPP